MGEKREIERKREREREKEKEREIEQEKKIILGYDTRVIIRSKD